MKSWKVVLLTVLAIVVATIVCGAVLLRRGFSARKQPSALETIVARTVRNWAIPRLAKEDENPWAELATPEVMADARGHWAAHCATCHANDGSGDIEMGQNLYPKPPDMRQPATQNLSDGELYYIIRNGVPLTGMPAWGDASLEQIGDDESWQLVLFIRHLPQLTEDEKKEMERLNPKSLFESEDPPSPGHAPASGSRQDQHRH